MDDRIKTPKILLVEDNELNSDMLSRRLIKKGYEVIHAYNGEEGIQMALRHHPDLILMDLSLPVMDGWEATRQLKSAPETLTIPVIALTAHAIIQEREKAMRAGCNEYETKPINFVQLIEKIQALLPATSF